MTADPAVLRAAAVYIALLVIAAPLLAMLVSRQRYKAHVSLGDGGNPALQRAIRVHGNYAEYAPFGLATLLALALVGAPLWCVHVVGLGFVIGRAVHAAGLSASGGPSAGRAVGTTLTWLTMLFAGGALLWLAL